LLPQPFRQRLAIMQGTWLALANRRIRLPGSGVTVGLAGFGRSGLATIAVKVTRSLLNGRMDAGLCEQRLSREVVASTVRAAARLSMYIENVR
jgi:hypothetical protein